MAKKSKRPAARARASRRAAREFPRLSAALLAGPAENESGADFERRVASLHYEQWSAWADEEIQEFDRRVGSLATVDPVALNNLRDSLLDFLKRAATLMPPLGRGRRPRTFLTGKKVPRPKGRPRKSEGPETVALVDEWKAVAAAEGRPKMSDARAIGELLYRHADSDVKRRLDKRIRIRLDAEEQSDRGRWKALKAAIRDVELVRRRFDSLRKLVSDVRMGRR